VLERICEQVPAIAALSSRKDGLSIAVTELRTSAFPTLLPHQVTAAIAMSHRETEAADAAETRLRALLESGRRQATVRRVADRPPLRERRGTTRLAKSLCAVAKEWDVPLGTGTSSWPSVAGLVPAKVPVLCGVAPTAHDLHTPHESIDRTSLLQRTLILTQFLARESGATP
jgi:D-alanine-D-alanine ligase